jgi:erythromycin esterase-like protein
MSRAALEAVRHAAVWFEPTMDGLDPLLESIGDARLVLIGEASRHTRVLSDSRGTDESVDRAQRFQRRRCRRP